MNATLGNSTYRALVNATVQGADAATQGVSTLARPEGLVSWGGYFQALAVLCLIIAALWAGLWYLKRRGGLRLPGMSNDLAVESRMSLGPKKNLMVVRFLNKRLLLGVTDQQITLLTELSDHDDPEPHRAGTTPKPASFKEILDAADSSRPGDNA